ncbi:hypothetical protein, partial [Aeromonas veronii]|uniref:hypothetical protein n=1 Tax=Aeromonas veronii TaxID=654 RepID=UPI001CA535A5
LLLLWRAEGYHQSAVGHLSPFIHECRTYYLNSRFTHDNKAPLLAHLNTLLGIPQTTLTWTYLNKGVHDEERDDFDAVEVESVVRLLEALDAMSWRAPRRG